MFSIYETRENREELLNKLLEVDRCIALVIAFLDFEWTIRRCILALGRSPTRVIREKFSGKRPIDFYCKDETTEQDMQEEKTHNKRICGIKGYKDLWNKEVQSLRKLYLFELLNSRVDVTKIKGFDQNKLNHLKLKEPEIDNTYNFLKFVYDRFRNTLVHGIRTKVQEETAEFVFNFIIACSGALCSYAEEQGESIYGRKILRRKTL